MAVTTGGSGLPTGVRWQFLLRPRWLAWHAFAVLASVGMLFLGDWQLHRAESGNELSWAYTFEWPLFAAFTVFFWIKSLRDELREPGTAGGAESGPASAATGGSLEAGGTGLAAAASAAASAPVTGLTAGATGGGAIGATQPASGVPVGGRADSWDSTSWDSTSWDSTGAQVGAEDAGSPRDLARATPADGAAYLARLMAEVQRPSRRRARH